MIGTVPENIIELLSSEVGILVLVLIGILEGVMLLYFMPSELLVPAGLFVYGTSVFDIISIVLLISVSTTVGQVILFMLSNKLGKKALLSQNWFKISEDKLEKYESWFDKWGIGVIPVTNSLPVVRGLATVPAGFSDLSLYKFAVISLTGTVIFESIIATLYVVGVEYLTVF
jgi:membrane protein DedA with SNARE-associated domain